MCAQLTARGNTRDAAALAAALAATPRRRLASGSEVAPHPSAATGQHVAELAFGCLGWVSFSRASTLTP